MGSKTNEKTRRYEMVANRIVNLINKGVLKEGDKIPSIRQLSNELNVSINTVKEAYWKLESRNYIKAVPQSGFYVKKQSSMATEYVPDDPNHLDPQEVSLCRIYGAFMNQGQCTPEISLAIATLNPALWPTEKMARFIQSAVRQQGFEAYNYIMPPGHSGLREQIARWGLSCGLDLSPEEIVVTNGCHESIFLALMAVCKPGDTVVLESPIYFNLLELLQQLKLKIIEIPGSDADGINLNTLRFVMDNHRVQAVFSISNCNNPMGFSMSRKKKRALVALLNEYGTPLIEDDVYGDLTFEQRPDTCKSYDTGGNVILCASFSKTIAPGLRIGWIVPGKYYDQVIKMKTLLNISTASVNQIAVARFLKEGGYDRHLRALRKTLSEQVAAMRAAILKYFPSGTRVTRPSGGFLLWIELPGAINTEAIYHQALKMKILIAPGHLFSVKPKYTNFMRLNAGIWNRQVEKAIQHIGMLCHQVIPSRLPNTATRGCIGV